MNQDTNFQIIFLWRQNDWGLYYRRNEAWFNELSQRSNVSRSLHVEHVTLLRFIKLFISWINAKDPKIKKTYFTNLKKTISLFPLLIDKKRNVFIYGVFSLINSDKPIIRNINTWLLSAQGKIINKVFIQQNLPVVLIIYPPANYLSTLSKVIHHDLLIADIVDDLITRYQHNHSTHQKYVEIYNDLLPRCKFVFSTFPADGSIFADISSKDILFLPNGVDCGSITTRNSNLEKQNYSKIVGYIGSINQTMDIDLFEYLLNHFKDTLFIIIGFITDYEGLKEKIDNLTNKYNNFQFWGERHYTEIPSLLNNFDVLINFKKNNYTTQGGDSIKIYQYLATGKPIVATPVPPAEHFSRLIYIASDKEKFANYLSKALDEDNPVLQQQRIQAANENSWSTRVDFVYNKILESL